MENKFFPYENYATYPTSNNRCPKCKYFNMTHHSCDYLERTGKLRRCPVESCDKFEHLDPDGRYRLSPGDFIFFGE